MWDHLALLGPRRRSAHPRLERVCSLSVCQLFRLSRFVPDFNVSGKTAEPKMAFNFAHLLSAACGGAPRRLGRLRRPWARCARLFWGGYQPRIKASPLPSLGQQGDARRRCSAKLANFEANLAVRRRGLS